MPVASFGSETMVGTVAVAADDDGEPEPGSVNLVLVNRLLLVDVGFSVSCCDRFSSSGPAEASTFSLRKGSRLFLRPAVDIWLPMRLEPAVEDFEWLP